MKERRPTKENEKIIPPNMTIAWSTSDVSYTDATYRAWLPEANKYGQVRLVGIMRDIENMPDDKYKQLFDKTLQLAMQNPHNQYHYVRIDNRKYVPENANNEPYSANNHWCKTMNLWGYIYVSDLG